MKTSFTELRCPFCNHAIEQPKELKERKFCEFPLGACEHCGAVYAFDATGHNQGAAFIEALLFACNNDDYLAFSLSAEEDFRDAVVEHYDVMTHRVAPEGHFDDRYIRGALIFVKLNKEFQEVTEHKVKERLRTALPVTKQKLRSENYSKEKVHRYALENNLEDLVALAGEDSRVLSELQRMLLTPDENLRWQVIDIIGAVSARVVEKQLKKINTFLYRLLYSANDSASSAWGALEASGAIIGANPDFFGEYCPTMLSFLQYKHLRKEVTWAIGRIATTKPELVKYAFRPLCSFLSDSDPFIRGYAAWALGNLGFSDAIDELKKLITDHQRLSLYRGGELQEVTVAQLATEAIEKLME
jgi:hypothetical protein